MKGTEVALAEVAHVKRERSRLISEAQMKTSLDLEGVCCDSPCS
jgi:hypothetical protein